MCDQRPRAGIKRVVVHLFFLGRTGSGAGGVVETATQTALLPVLFSNGGGLCAALLSGRTTDANTRGHSGKLTRLIDDDAFDRLEASW